MVNWSSRKFKENKQECWNTYIFVTLQCIIILESTNELFIQKILAFTKNFILKLTTNNYTSVRNRNSTLKSNYFLISAMMITDYTSFIHNSKKRKNYYERKCYIVTNSKNPDKQFPKTTHGGGSLPTIILLDITTTFVISQQIRTVIQLTNEHRVRLVDKFRR